MEYIALYRKYRPNELDSVVGQNEIKKILANSVENNTISHAYLFSGPRGTGKTTMAKIFAKMVNCESPIHGNSCCKCNSCLHLLDSNDIVEIDAASNNGVDEIRELREKATLVPSLCKYKVYIIDEVHMLTTQAFNALLKTLEEPPKHVIFILATTEYHKIPLTITSRCQKFQFNKIDIEDIVKRLKEISEIEKIEIDSEALYEIAKISDGGMRDSINFLDQIRSFSVDRITIDDVYEVCGSVSANEIVDLFLNIRNNDVEYVVSFFEKMDNNGKSYNKFFEDVISFLKNIVLYKNDVSAKLIKENMENVKKIANLYSLDEIFSIINLINNLVEKLRYVSRQSIMVVTDFLQILYELNSKKNDVLVNDSNVSNNNFELAFEFTSNDKNSDSKVTENIVNRNVELSKEKFNDKNKSIIINNAFALADKKEKAKLQGKFLKLNDYLTDKKFTSAASMLIDTNVEVAGAGYLILSGNYDAVIDNIYGNYNLCLELINDLCSSDYKFSIVTLDEWKNLKEQYIKKIKSGEKYEILNFVDESKNLIINEKKETTAVDKLFDIVGEEYIEYK